MKRAILGVSAAAALALAPICIPPAHADPCTDTGDPHDCGHAWIQYIPPGYPEGACQPTKPSSPNAVASVDCVNNTMPGGPPFARTERFADQNALGNAFQADARSAALQPCPGSSDSAPASWKATNPPPANGSVICYTSSDNVAHVEWTNIPAQVKIDAAGPDMASLYGWWHGLVTTS
jgi:hypothetical protein